MSSDVITRLNAALEGRYRVDRELGEGGMATVYLADDLRHERKVALKVLKPELAAVVGADRFLGEIKTTANLQHPHILPLFDSGEADAFLYYVMPYVQGETLRDRLEREKQLPVDEAVRITIDIADALHAAHEQGVIHRDIKPANILLSKGRPLVADFGIALAVSAAGGGRLTETGLSMGTPYYMSPEQASADRDPSAASDVYSLGCVLYEMLVGEPPHVGSTAQAVLARILTEDAPTVTAARKSVPLNVDAAVRRSLEKLPADRFTAAHDFSRALSDPNFRYGATGDSDTTAAALPETRRWKVAAIAAMAVSLALTARLATSTLGGPRTQAPVRLSIALDPPLAPALSGSLAISGDGGTIVYAGGYGTIQNYQLWVRRLGELRSTPISDTDVTSFPTLSPDGRSVAYLGGENSLWMTALENGSPRRLLATIVCCPHWAVDGFVYATQGIAGGAAHVVRVPADGGAAETVTSPGPGEAHGSPVVTPDGKHLIYVASVPGEPAAVMIRALSTGDEQVLFQRATQAWLVSERLIAYTTPQGVLMAVRFDPRRLEVTGEPVTIAEGVGLHTALLPTLASSRSGTLVYETEAAGAAQYQPIWIDRSGRQQAVDPEWSYDPVTIVRNFGFAISPDGRRVAVSRNREGAQAEGIADIWVKQLPAGPFSRLSSGSVDESRPRWTPDGAGIAYVAQGGMRGDFSLTVQDLDGVTDPRVLLDASNNIMEAAFSPDGRWLVTRTGTAGVNASLDLVVWQMQDGGGYTEVSRLSTDAQERAVGISPDGRWLAYETDETGRTEVYVHSFPDLTRRREQVSVAGGVMPVWGKTGEDLFFVNAERNLVAVDVTLGDDLRIGERRVLFGIDDDILLSPEDFYPQYEPDTDDARFMMLRRITDPVPGEVVIIFNLIEEIEARLGS